jgi:hypothetical protein
MKHLLLDMYGVILKEAKGSFRRFLEERKPEADFSLYRENYHCVSKGFMKTEDFLSLFGFKESEQAICDYVENYLTFDSEFTLFAESCTKHNIDMVLLSNDIAEYMTTLLKSLVPNLPTAFLWMTISVICYRLKKSV